MTVSAPEEGLGEIELYSASRTWEDGAAKGPMRLDAEAELPSAARDGVTKTPSVTRLRAHRPDGAIGLQVWVDVPHWFDDGLANDQVPAVVERAAAALVTVVEARFCVPDRRHCDELRAQLRRQVCDWVRAASGPDDAHVGWRPGCVPSCDADVFVRTLTQPRVALVGITYRRRGSDRRWIQRKTLRIALGPDRYGLIVQSCARSRQKGDVPCPNEPFQTRFGGAVETLGEAVDELKREVDRLERDVGETLTGDSSKPIAPLLGQRARLMAQRHRLERRRRDFLFAYDQLAESWRADGFDLDPDEREQLTSLDGDLERISDRLGELPQLLLAVDSWRQAKRAVDQGRRTELLSSAAAALVLPTLVAGVLGANVLPWEPKAGPEALIGMLVLMVACALGAVWLLRRLVFTDPGGEDAAAGQPDDGSARGAAGALARAWHHRATPWAIAVLAVAGCAGIGLGTTTEDPAAAGAEPPAAQVR